MPLTPLENELRGRARALIGAGTLPGAAPSRVWGGRGRGETCALCSKGIHPEEVQDDIELGNDENRRIYRFHFLCHAAWQFECARAEHLSSKRA
jgi:hypothetical protein